MRKRSSNTKRLFMRLAEKAIDARERADGMPFVLAHFVTHRCMCDCRSCLWKHNDWEDVPLDVLKRFYREAKDMGFAAVAISGGEPFMRRDLGEIVRYLKQDLGMGVLVFTTGWYLHKRMDEVLPHIDMLMCSLDSAKAERHDTVRRLPGLFDRLMDAVDLVVDLYPELSVQFNSCVQKGIEAEIEDLVALATRKGVPISFDVITQQRNGADGAAFTETDVGLPPGELEAVCSKLLALKRSGAPILNSERYFDYFARGGKGYRCHFPKLAMAVDGRGNVEDCLDLDHPIGNIRTDSLAEIVARPRFKELRKAAEGCSSCSSPTMVDMSHVWENPLLVFLRGGVATG